MGTHVTSFGPIHPLTLRCSKQSKKTRFKLIFAPHIYPHTPTHPKKKSKLVHIEKTIWPEHHGRKEGIVRVAISDNASLSNPIRVAPIASHPISRLSLKLYRGLKSLFFVCSWRGTWTMFLPNTLHFTLWYTHKCTQHAHKHATDTHIHTHPRARAHTHTQKKRRKFTHRHARSPEY